MSASRVWALSGGLWANGGIASSKFISAKGLV